MANQKSIRVEKVGIREFRICGYTRPYAAQLMAAGAEWQGRELYWRYTGDVLPASIQNIIIGQFALQPETPMDSIIDEPEAAGESGETTVVNFKDVMEYWDKTRQKWTDAQYVYIGRANGHYHLPTSRWANNHVMQDESQRQQVIDAYRQGLLKMDRATLRAELKKLAGKTLVCWCKKADQEVACHGDVLVEFIKNPPLEVVVHESAPVEPVKPAKEKSGSKIAEKLRKLAEGMQKEIDHQNRSYPFESQPPTRKRVNEYLSRKREVRPLIVMQDKLLALASARESLTLDPILSGLQSKVALDWLIYRDRMPRADDISEETAYNNLVKAGVSSANYEAVRAAFLVLGNPDAGRVSKEDELEEKRLEVALREYDDYFPTSMRWLQDKMIDAADIQREDIILEPSAGTGHLAQAIRAAYPDNKLICIERVWDFVVILELQKFDTIHGDFLEGNERADVILMNPPFTNMADIEHVYHAFEQLNSGGRLVSIMSVAPFFNQQKRAAAFRQWFSKNGGHMEKLREGAFKESERSTGVATVMIVMRKPKEATEDPVVEHAEKNRQWENEVAAAEAVAREAVNADEPDAIEKIAAAVEVGQQRPVFPVDIQPSDIKPVFKNAGSDYGFVDNASGRNVWIGVGTMDDFKQPTPKPDVTTVEGAAQILYGPKPEDAQPLTYDDYTRIKSLYPDESQIVMLHVGAMWTTWDDDAETLEMAMKASQKGVRHPVMVLKSKDTAGRTITLYTADLYVERFEEAVKAANLSLIKVNKDGSVRICNTLETASQNAQNINSTSTLVVAPQGAENAKNDATAQKLTALVNALRKPAPESELPFIALYISGSQNVALLFEHYVEAIRTDDPDMKLSRAKELAAAVLLYQYQQEWVATDVETKYPAIFEAFKAAAKGEILISMLLRISGGSGIVELTYDDDLMEHIVDVVAQTPF